MSYKPTTQFSVEAIKALFAVSCAHASSHADDDKLTALDLVVEATEPFFYEMPFFALAV